MARLHSEKSVLEANTEAVFTHGCGLQKVVNDANVPLIVERGARGAERTISFQRHVILEEEEPVLKLRELSARKATMAVKEATETKRVGRNVAVGARKPP